MYMLAVVIRSCYLVPNIRNNLKNLVKFKYHEILSTVTLISSYHD